MNSTDPIYGKVVALTGIRHSGKSSAARFFAEKGAAIVNADDLAREAVAPGSEGLKRIFEEFGPSFFDASGALDRKALAAEIYRHPERRLALEAIIHPVVRRLAVDAFSTALRGGASVVVYDCPLFFEAGLAELGFRGVVVLESDPRAVIPRIMARDGVDEADAAVRLAAQMSQEEKLKRATWVLDNRGSLDDLRRGVDCLYEELRPGS